MLFPLSSMILENHSIGYFFKLVIFYFTVYGENTVSNTKYQTLFLDYAFTFTL